ncbi:unnamed protein product [Aphanomyces euteiches]
MGCASPVAMIAGPSQGHPFYFALSLLEFYFQEILRHFGYLFFTSSNAQASELSLLLSVFRASAHAETMSMLLKDLMGLNFREDVHHVFVDKIPQEVEAQSDMFRAAVRRCRLCDLDGALVVNKHVDR